MDRVSDDNLGNLTFLDFCDQGIPATLKIRPRYGSNRQGNQSIIGPGETDSFGTIINRQVVGHKREVLKRAQGFPGIPAGPELLPAGHNPCDKPEWRPLIAPQSDP